MFDLVLDAKVRLDLLDVLVLLDEALGIEALVVADLAQLLDTQLVGVGRLRVDLLLVLELAHLAVLRLEAVTETPR